jgi:hypothetical protein
MKGEIMLNAKKIIGIVAVGVGLVSAATYGVARLVMRRHSGAQLEEHTTQSKEDMQEAVAKLSEYLSDDAKDRLRSVGYEL